MFKWLKNLFKKNKQVIDQHGRPIQDNMYIDAVNEAFISGKPVIASRKNDGSYSIKRLD